MMFPLTGCEQAWPDQAAHPLASDRVAQASQAPGHLARAIPRRLQELRVDRAHQLKVQRALPLALVVEWRAADRDQGASPDDAEPAMTAVRGRLK